MSDILAKLEERIVSRQKEQPDDSYVARLYQAGIPKMAQKVGEEGVEVALAAVLGDQKALVGECADLIFHTLVLLAASNVSFRAVEEELSSRMK
jgi:phosphoribosyl-ATP pyrophosphohydrolase/phosphoribosyl-AMP cyclohydrolase